MASNRTSRINVSDAEITRVHNLIEHHLLRNMSKSQTMAAMSANHNVDPQFTKIVWEQLEEENAEFFRAYYTKQVLISQINQFNELLERQARLMFGQEPAILSESVSSASSVVTSGHSVNFGNDHQEASSGSTITMITDAKVQSNGEKQGADNESGASNGETPPNN